MNIKAIVFKTALLQATREFFETVLQVQPAETSPRHFVLATKGIRLVFMESPDDFSIEIYAEDAIHELKTLKDPNGIHIIIRNK